MQIFDAVIILASFALDLVFLEGIGGAQGEEAAAAEVKKAGLVDSDSSTAAEKNTTESIVNTTATRQY